MAKIKNICVIGTEEKGLNISKLCALKGFKTVATDINPKSPDETRCFEKACIRYTNKMENALHDADYIIEAVEENLNIKKSLFSAAETMVPKHAIFATTSAHFKTSEISDAIRRPDRFINLHFFNPVLDMNLVELVRGPHTSEETLQLSLDLCKSLDKTCLHIQNECNGSSVFEASNQIL